VSVVAPAQRPAAPVPNTHTPTTIRFLVDLARNPIEAFGQYAYHEPYVYKRSVIRHLLMVNDPEGVRHILLDNAGNYVKSDQAVKRVRPVAGNGLLTAEGASWKFQRRTAAPIFQMRRVAGFAPDMTAATQALLSRWGALPEGAVIDIGEEMMRLTFDIISRTVFSNEITTDYSRIAHSMATYLDNLGRITILDVLGLPGWVPTPARMRARPAIKFFRNELGALIDRRREKFARDPSSMPDDLLTLLLTAKDPEEGALFSADEIYDNVSTFVLAGHETTANALTWTFYLLSQFADHEATLATEIRDTLKSDGATAEDVPALVFTRAVIEESMRLYPPAPVFARDSVNADKVGPNEIEPKTAIMIAPWVIHRHRKLWDAPDYFRPERFTPGLREKINRFAYLPFGGGPRICIGMAFAMQEAIIILSTIAQRYRLELMPGQKVEPLARITLRPRYGLKMKLVKR
jgi:cytochrome P450